MLPLRFSLLLAGAFALAACAGGEPPSIVVDGGGGNDVRDVPTPPADGGRRCATDDDCTAADLCSNAQACRLGVCVVVGGSARCDDSVARITTGGLQFIRRARGYTPRAIKLPVSGPAVLAVGGLTAALSGSIRTDELTLSL